MAFCCCLTHASPFFYTSVEITCTSLLPGPEAGNEGQWDLRIEALENIAGQS
jgi:hypothetical protein